MSLETLTLVDSRSGARARIAPGIGFNCYSFEVPTSAGPVETLWTAADFLTGKGCPSGSGIPLLFPFAGRIRGTAFRYDGKQYNLTAGDGQGNAIHGFVIDRPWRVTRHEADRVRGEFQASLDDAALLDHWPSDFRITAEYAVTGNSLVADYTVDNPGTSRLPFGFGTHPYFRIPLGSKNAAACRVTVGVEGDWQLEGLLPTGHNAPSATAAELARGATAGGLKLDHVFSGLKFENHLLTATVSDPNSKRTLAMTFDDRFTACVVYTPPHREAVCIEPYTTIPDPFTLAEKGIDPHLQTLDPGQSFQTRIEIRLD